MARLRLSPTLHINRTPKDTEQLNCFSSLGLPSYGWKHLWLTPQIQNLWLKFKQGYLKPMQLPPYFCRLKRPSPNTGDRQQHTSVMTH